MYIFIHLRVLHFIKVISKERWAKDPKFLTHLVRSLVRNRLTYGMDVFHSLPPYQLKELQAIETKALKIALGIPTYAINRLVYSDIGWLPLPNLMNLNRDNFLTRWYAAKTSTDKEFVQTINNPFFNYSKFENKNSQLYLKTKNIIYYTRDLFTEANLNYDDVFPHPTAAFPQWEREEMYFDTVK